jgi:hypothetical protein
MLPRICLEIVEMPCRQSMLRTLLRRHLFLRSFPRRSLLALAVAAAASQASAQNPITSNETFKTIIGKWEISNADRDRTCYLTFKTDPSGALFKLDLDKACTAQMPELKDVTGWTIGGLDLVKLMDSKGKAVLEFSEVESGIFEAQRPGEGVFFMQNAGAAAAAANVSFDQMAGDWGVVRGSGKTVCVITLSNTAAGDDAFALSVKPGCQNFVTGFAPAAWYLDRGELVLKSSKAGRFWRFEANNPTTWQRVPEGPEPVNLVRQVRQ